jgi:hypothetical protein
VLPIVASSSELPHEAPPAIERVRRTPAARSHFAVLIPSWNNLGYLQLCIRSLRTHSTVPLQLIVHVNDGSDGTLEWVRSQPDLDYSWSATNVGVCHALNSCRALVDAPYLVYLNDDMYVCPGWDTALSDEIARLGHDRFFLSSTCIEPSAQSNCMIEQNYGTDLASFDEARLLQDYAALPMADWQGATWPPNVVPTALWDEVGGYSVEFTPGMYSDPDFSMKLWHAGVRMFKGVSASRAYHFGSKSVTRIRKNPGYYTFLRKWTMTSSTLSKYYLRRGERFDGPLGEARVPISATLKNVVKRQMLMWRGR